MKRAIAYLALGFTNVVMFVADGDRMFAAVAIILIPLGLMRFLRLSAEKRK